MKVVRIVITVAALLLMLNAADDFSTNMMCAHSNGWPESRASLSAWLGLFVILSLPAWYAFQSRWTQGRMVLSFLAAGLYLVLALFPQQIVVPIIAKPMVGCYDSDYMDMGSIMGGAYYYVNGRAFHFLNAMLGLMTVSTIGGAIEWRRRKAFARLIQITFPEGEKETHHA